MKASITCFGALSSLLCLACADIHEPTRSGVTHPRLTVDGGPEAGPDTGTNTNGGGSDRSTSGESRDEPELRRVVAPKPDDPKQVWVGELWSVGFSFCNPESKEAFEESELSDVVPVVLSFEPNERGEVGGSIQFGKLDGRRIPDAPSGYDRWHGDPGTEAESFWLCSVQLPIKGFEYRLVDLERTAERVTFTFVPNLVWDTFCRTSKPACPSDSVCERLPFCECAAGECTAELEGGFPVSLKVDGDIMDGPFIDGTYGALRLRRVY